MRHALLSLLTLFLVAGVAAQQDATSRPGSSGPVLTSNERESGIPPGTSVTDSKGRSVNNGASTGGKVRVKYTGKLKRTGNEWTITGEISEVNNKQSGGSNGPISVNTNGEETTINLDRNGLNGSPINSGVSGGNATINVSGDNNGVTVNGTNNTVNVSGSSNTVTANGGSSGSCHLGGSGNSFGGVGAGGWTVGN